MTVAPDESRDGAPSAYVCASDAEVNLTQDLTDIMDADAAAHGPLQLQLHRRYHYHRQWNRAMTLLSASFASVLVLIPRQRRPGGLALHSSGPHARPPKPPNG